MTEPDYGAWLNRIRSGVAELVNKGALELQGTFFDEISLDLHQLLG